MIDSPSSYGVGAGSLAIVALVALGGCAAAPRAPMSAPEAPSAPAPSAVATPTTAEDAAAELDRAEAELSRAFGEGSEKESLAGGVGHGAEVQSADRAAEPKLAEGGACDIACRALGSMQRAATHLCELAGDGDGRCASAKARVDGARERVHASCPACGD
jgi:hypothetical protein